MEHNVPRVVVVVVLFRNPDNDANSLEVDIDNNKYNKRPKVIDTNKLKRLDFSYLIYCCLLGTIAEVVSGPANAATTTIALLALTLTPK